MPYGRKKGAGGSSPKKPKHYDSGPKAQQNSYSPPVHAPQQASTWSKKPPKHYAPVTSSHANHQQRYTSTMTIENNDKNNTHNTNAYERFSMTEALTNPYAATNQAGGPPTTQEMHEFANGLRATVNEAFGDPTEAEADFTISANKRKTYRVNLVGELYSVAVPKTGALMKLNLQNISTNGTEDIEKVMNVLSTLIKTIFVEKKEAARVLERLEDENDDLDVENIYELINKLQEIAGKAVNLPPTR
nr:MAG TPA: hypothetical protein [Caudoviricetes sp.]